MEYIYLDNNATTKIDERVFAAMRLYLTNMTFSGYGAGKLPKGMETHGIYATSGAACTEGRSPSHVLAAMGLTPPEALSSIRFGFSCYNTEAEIHYVIGVLAMFAKNLRIGAGLSAAASA